MDRRAVGEDVAALDFGLVKGQPKLVGGITRYFRHIHPKTHEVVLSLAQAVEQWGREILAVGRVIVGGIDLQP
ncbi:MAG: hypothetical protein D6722_14250 [Bacteroidetes bacterium]|nr:MAG: hypothetical protein D6722_14250 [Bacteroidota bacterium]